MSSFAIGSFQLRTFLISVILALFAFAVEAAPLIDAAPVRLWRLDCGKIIAFDLDEFSDTRAYVGQQKELTDSCYLIRHGDTYMLWDTGLPKTLIGHVPNPNEGTDGTLQLTIVQQLAELGIKPEAISIIGISHEHFDHTGQAADFPRAKLLMGKGDIDDMRGPNVARGKPLLNWLRGDAPMEAVKGDKDIFGDGSVVMLDLPGHTPGNHGLLIRLQSSGIVLLSGDTAHFRENYASNGVPSFNSNRAESLASLDRLKKLAANLQAKVIIQHEPADIAKLPAFPKFAN